ncbi:CCA-adding enzyme [uncultured archaeon]|nr:CCA-adding enzyme [uncultured archaeon]
MKEKIEKIIHAVLEKVTPSPKEAMEQAQLSGKLISKIKSMEGSHLKAELVGSNSRNTNLAGDHDLDIFVFYPESLPREEFEKEGLAIGRAVFRGHEWEKAYSEHPYIRGRINGFDVEIVPAYLVSSAERIKSAVDRTLFHSEYVKNRIEKGQEQEVRLLKQFMKGVKCYGADLSSNSFPGYVAEILIIKYGTFRAAINAVSKWGREEIIDLEGSWGIHEAKNKFNSHLMVVDPVDRNRNVAAALSQNQYARFIAAARAFLKKPSIEFFFPKPHKAWPAQKLRAFLKKTELVMVMIGYPKGIVEDIMWGQLKRFARKVSTLCHAEGFAVKRTAEWLEHKKHLVILLEVESAKIQKAKIITGPEATDAHNSEQFLKAHKKPLAGPRIENGRWVLEVERKHTDIELLLAELLKKLKTQEREGIAKALRTHTHIMEEKDILALYRKNKEFQQFLTAYLKGEEEFLDY